MLLSHFTLIAEVAICIFSIGAVFGNRLENSRWLKMIIGVICIGMFSVTAKDFIELVDVEAECYRLHLDNLPPKANVELPEHGGSFTQGQCFIPQSVLVKVRAPGYSVFKTSVDLSTIDQRLDMAQQLQKIPVSSMIYIDQGSFMMGCDGQTQNHSVLCPPNEQPQHRVKVSEFYMAKTEVTFEEYDYYCRSVSHCSLPDDKGWGRGKQPVINVSWDDAQAYIVWLNEQTQGNYRLPTEAEWEYVARAGSRTAYSWGDAEAALYSNGSQRLTQGFAQLDNFKYASPVASFKANAWGVHDMFGNVWEWCQDWYAEDYYQDSPVKNPNGAVSGEFRSVRGSSWLSWPHTLLRSSARGRHRAAYKNFDIGFRLAQDLND